MEKYILLIDLAKNGKIQTKEMREILKRAVDNWDKL